VIGQVGHPATGNQREVFRRLRSDLGVRELWTIAGRVEFDSEGLPQIMGAEGSK
jgi:hypothetical protein